MWTHLVGFGYFAVVGSQLCNEIVSSKAGIQEETVWVLIQVLATSLCLLFSFSYHLCLCTGRGTCQCMYRMDLAGIMTLIAATYFCGIALAYRCFARLRILYLAYALVVVLLLVWPLCKRHVESMARHMIFCAALGLVPAIHPFFIFSQEELRTIMPYVFAMFMCYGVGAAVFTSKWPECKWPGRFDILGHSHQVWHVFVVLAAVIWVEATLMMRRRSRDVGCELDSST